MNQTRVAPFYCTISTIYPALLLPFAATHCGPSDGDKYEQLAALYDARSAARADMCEQAKACYPEEEHPENGCSLPGTTEGGYSFLTSGRTGTDSVAQYRSCLEQLSDAEFEEIRATAECGGDNYDNVKTCLSGCPVDGAQCGFDAESFCSPLSEAVNAKLDPCDPYQ